MCTSFNRPGGSSPIEHREKNPLDESHGLHFFSKNLNFIHLETFEKNGLQFFIS